MKINTNAKQQVLDDDIDQDILRAAASFNQDIISKSAFLILTLILGILVTISVVIDYPEIVSGRAKTTGLDVVSNLYCINLDVTNDGEKELDSGQIVKLQFDDYPYLQTGFITGVIQTLDHGGIDNGLRAFLYLPSGLTTNLGRTIRFKPGLGADIQILVKNIKLIQHIFSAETSKKVHSGRSQIKVYNL